MRTTALPFRLFAGLLLTTLSVGCDEPTAADLAMEDGEEADETAPGNAVPEAGLEAEVDPQGILGGNSLDSDRDVMVLNATTPEPCSGTLLRNNVVLTARHCVAVGGEEDEPALVDASELFVLQDGPGDSWADGEGVAEIAVIPGTYVDVALVRLSSAMTIDGEVRGESTEIWPRPDVDMVGEAALCQGYGAIECIESRYGTPIGAADAIGRLRWGLVNIHGVNDNGEDWMILKTLSSSGNWLPSAGDSGSACRLPWFAQRNRQRITGVVSEGSVCEGHPGEDGWSAFEVQPSVFRDWARGQMAEWAGGDFDDDYSSGYLASVVSPPDIPTNTVQTMVSVRRSPS